MTVIKQQHLHHADKYKPLSKPCALLFDDLCAWRMMQQCGFLYAHMARLHEIKLVSVIMPGQLL